jgi:hypothetical protein
MGHGAAIHAPMQTLSIQPYSGWRPVTTGLATLRQSWKAFSVVCGRMYAYAPLTLPIPDNRQ